MTNYEQELDALDAAYRAVVEVAEPGALRDAFSMLSTMPLLAVASGGAMPVAELASTMHAAVTGQSAMASSPLRMIELVASGMRGAVVVFSSRARHLDTEAAVDRALLAELPVVLMTERSAAELSGALADARVVVVQVPGGDPPDGFLATGSVIRMAAMVQRLYGERLAERLPRAEAKWSALRSRLLVLHGLEGRPAAVDVETRLHELGLADVQLADYRNFAHGRHVGLARRGNETSVLALITPQTEEISSRTLELVGSEVDVHRVVTTESGAIAQIALLSAVMPLPLVFASLSAIEPSKPRVGLAGRKLYHLPLKRTAPRPFSGPVARKVRAAGLAAHNVAGRQIYESAYQNWASRVGGSQLDAVVLDYDGTCVTTPGRFGLPGPEVQKALLRVLDAGVPIVFASGRGDSLYRDLRDWVPSVHWAAVDLGLHNGSWRQKLSDPLHGEVDENSEWVDALVDGIGSFESAGLVTIRATATQISLVSRSELTLVHLQELTRTVIESLRLVDLRVSRSGHSVDITSALAGKDRVLRDAALRFGNVLAIGDQGDVGGNDFEMLAGTTASMSVDRVSADPTRCWNIAPPRASGPGALVFSLSKLRQRRGRLYLTPPVDEDGQ